MLRVFCPCVAPFLLNYIHILHWAFTIREVNVISPSLWWTISQFPLVNCNFFSEVDHELIQMWTVQIKAYILIVSWALWLLSSCKILHCCVMYLISSLHLRKQKKQTNKPIIVSGAHEIIHSCFIEFQIVAAKLRDKLIKYHTLFFTFRYFPSLKSHHISFWHLIWRPICYNFIHSVTGSMNTGIHCIPRKQFKALLLGTN